MKVSILEMTRNPIENIYRAYRVCYSGVAPSEIVIPTIETAIGDIPDSEAMMDFIKPLLDQGHFSPLEHVSVTFAIEGASRGAQQQITRHRTGKYNIQSQRYVDASKFSCVIPPTVLANPEAERKAREFIEKSKELYRDLVDNYGIPKEDARYFLPIGTDGHIIMTMDMRNFRGFLAHRLCVGAQWEVNEITKSMLSLVKQEIPFIDYNVMNCGRICNKCFLRER